MASPPDLAGLPLRPLAPAGGAANASVTTNLLSMVMQQQLQSNWCWSAVATSVGLFLNTGQWTQCATVNACLPSTVCCDNPVPSTCNTYGYLNQSLTYTRSFNPPYLYGPYSAAEVQAQIDLGQPVCVRVQWNGSSGAAHFLAITGYSYTDPSSVTITLQDSIYGTTSMAYDDFPAQYELGGTWTNTYLTKKNP